MAREQFALPGATRPPRPRSLPLVPAGGLTLEHGLFLVLVAGASALTLLLVLAGGQFGFSTVLVGVVCVLVAAAVIWRPVTGLYLVAGCALLIEQDALATPIFTDHLYVFGWPNQLQGLPERPIGFVILFILLVCACQRFARREWALRGGALLWPFVLLLLCVALGVAHGLATGGAFRIIVLEVRPFWYFFVSYLLAYNLVTELRQIQTFLWITILATAFKALQGIYVVIVALHGHVAGQNAILAHEQSYFFVLVLVLLVLFCLHQAHRAQLVVVLVALPLLLPALVANNRRADYVAFLLGAAVAWALVVAIRPRARRWLIAGGIVCAVLGAAYVLAFANAGGTIGAPAHAILSVIHPSSQDARDLSSNVYRYIENYDLKYTEQQNPLLGYGFGKPFLQPIVLPNILALDPYYLYIPHNNIYWVWMRLGPLGFAALWYVIGSIIVRGSLLARHLTDPLAQRFAIFVVAAMVMEVVVAYSDYQFFFYRNIIYIGLLAGILIKLPQLVRAPAPPSDLDQEGNTAVNEDPRGVSPPALSYVGSRHA